MGQIPRVLDPDDLIAPFLSRSASAYVQGTSPTEEDTDGDGLLDGVDPDPLGSAEDPLAAGEGAPVGSFLVIHVAPVGSHVAVDTTLVVTFNHAVDLASVSSDNLVLKEVLPPEDVHQLEVVAQTNSRSLVLRPTGGDLDPSTTYSLTVEAGAGAIENLSGTAVLTTTTAFFHTGSATPPLYEARNYLATLAYTPWEQFPLLVATAKGRLGGTVVVPSTHKLLHVETDVSTPGRGLTVDITRTYRNNEVASTYSGSFGAQWFFNWDERFEVVADTAEDADTAVELLRYTEDGRAFVFLSDGGTSFPDEYKNPPGFHEQLKSVTDGAETYLVARDPFGNKRWFRFWRPGTGFVSPGSLQAGDVGYLMRLTDSNQNQITITRFAGSDGSRPHRVDKINDDRGWDTKFYYADSNHPDLVTRIAQFSNLAEFRDWLYTYDSNGRLVEVETPPTNFKDETGTVVNGVRKSREYTYASSGGYEELTSIRDGRGTTSLRVFYDQAHDVVQLDYGAGADAGTALYSWAVVDGVTRATQVDRNGNVCVLAHEDQRTSPFQNISSCTVPTRGLHPTTPTTEHQSGEPAQYVTTFLHNDHSSLILVTAPLGNAVGMIRCAECDCWEQCFLFGNDPESTEDDAVWVCQREPYFHQVRLVIPPRGNCMTLIGGTVSQVEDIPDQVAREWSLSSGQAQARDAFATYLYYDHQDVQEEVDADVTAAGFSSPFTWFANVDMPRTHGSVNSSGLHEPSTTVFATDAFGYPQRGGNAVAVRGPRPEVVDPEDWTLGDHQAIESFAAFNQFGQPFFLVQPDGAITRREYYQTGFMRGYLRLQDVDTDYRDADMTPSTGLTDGSPSGDGLALETIFEWTPVGDMTKLTNPRGYATDFNVNFLSLTTSTRSPAPFQFLHNFIFDGNNNMVEEQVQNKVPVDFDGDGIQLLASATEQQSGAKPDFISTYLFNSANAVMRVDLDAYDGAPKTLTYLYQRDRKQLVSGVRKPEGNSDWVRRDERDLVYEHIQGASDPARAKHTRFDHDLNGALIQVSEGDGSTFSVLWHIASGSDPEAYDHLFRPAKFVDALGNATLSVMDKEGRTVRQAVVGQARSRGDAATTPLMNVITSYDQAGRVFQEARELFGVNSGEKLSDLELGTRLSNVAPGGVSSSMFDSVNNELAFTLLVWSQDSNLEWACDDNRHAARSQYDGADRPFRFTDHLGSVREVTYDAASNPIRIMEIEKDSNGGAAGTFYLEQFFDPMDRLFARVSNLGNAERFLWDSRGLLVGYSDAMGPNMGQTIADLPTAGEHGTFPQGSSLPINARGNTSRSVFDGLGRMLTSIRELRQDGTGGSQVVGQIVTSTRWDGNNRVSARVDPNGNPTAYVYDHQDRLIRELAADGTDRKLVWNPIGTLAFEVDGRGVAKSHTYDALHRLVETTVSGLPPGAGQTTFVAADFDGLGRRTKVEDDDSRVETWFDSFSRARREDQTVEVGAPRSSKGQGFSGAAVTGSIQRGHDGVGNLVKLTYPSAAAFERRHDEVDRLKTIKDGFGGGASTFATFLHAGMGGRRLQRDYTPSGGAAMRQLLEFDGERRVVSLENYKVSGSARIAGFGYAWDRANNRRWERRLTGALQDESSGPGEAYRYDSAYRLVHEDRDADDASLDAIGNNLPSVPSAPLVLANASSYVLDASSNRRQTTIAGVTVGYALQAGAPTQDLAMNQYSVIGAAVRQHDLMGNLTASSDSGRQAFYDCDNRLIQWKEGAKDVRYRYDPDGRRIMKQDVGSSSFPTTLFFWDGWQTVEETDSAGVLTRRYVWGEGIDEIVRATVPDKPSDLDDDSVTAETVDLYFHHNSLGSVAAVTNHDGTVVESYRYAAFGKPTIFDQSGAEIASSYVEQPFMWTGARFDAESGLYQMRLRYYDPSAGRFISRDPLGLWGDPSQNGNGQGYCGHNPVNWVDPLGQFVIVVVAGPAITVTAAEAAVAIGALLVTIGVATHPDEFSEAVEWAWWNFSGLGIGIRLFRQACDTFGGTRVRAAPSPGRGTATRSQPRPQPRPQEINPPPPPPPPTEDAAVEFVSIWKAPQPGHPVRRWLASGFSPSDFPIDPRNLQAANGHAHFAAPGSRPLAEDFNRIYGQGIIEIRMRRSDYDRMFRQFERLYQAGPYRELAIPAGWLPALNAVTIPPRVLHQR